jgi:sulfur-oxidizing protein SoxY
VCDKFEEVIGYMDKKRRTFVKGTLAGATVGVAISAGLLAPRTVLAAWPKEAFESKTVADALKAVAGADTSAASGDITVKAPDIAENGAVVPVTVSTTLNAESISIFAEKNPNPLVATFNMGANTEGYVSTRIKMSKTSPVIGVVKSGGKLFSARKEVKVTIGGCGG